MPSTLQDIRPKRIRASIAKTRKAQVSTKPEPKPAAPLAPEASEPEKLRPPLRIPSFAEGQEPGSVREEDSSPVYDKLFGGAPNTEVQQTQELDEQGNQPEEEDQGQIIQDDITQNAQGDVQEPEGEKKDKFAAALTPEMATVRKEFVFGIFLPSLIALPVLSLVIWYFYWFITKMKEVPPPFQFRRPQKIVLIIATLITFILGLLILLYIASWVCSGITGVIIKAFTFMSKITLGSDAGISDFCKQYKDVISEYSQFFSN